MRLTPYYVLIILFLLTTSCSKKYYLSDVQSRSYKIEKTSYAVDVKVAQIIEPYKGKLEKTMNEVIGYCDEQLIKGKPGSTLTNWFADVLLEESRKLVTDKIDFAVQNYGGIRIPSLAKGDITIGAIFELMPFDNTACIQELSGSTVKMLFDRIAEAGGWPVSGDVSMEIAYGKAQHILIDGIALDTSKKYVVVMPDYLVNGGDNLTFLKEVPSRNTGALIRDLIISNIKRKQELGEHVIPNNTIRIKN